MQDVINDINIIEEDLGSSLQKSQLRFRFPPEPNGYLHIGHTKAIGISFGLGEKYRETLKSKNANLESYFDQYVDRDGNWNHEQFNMHRTVVDNIDEIVRAVYQQGMSDGQRKVVETAANVKVNTPNVGNVQPGNNVEEQLRQIIGESDSMMRFRF